MSRPFDPADRLRQIAPSDAPTREQRLAAREALNVAIASETQPAARRSTWRKRVALPAMVALLVAIGITTRDQKPVSAAMIELAEATRTLPVLSIAEGEAVFTSFEATWISISENPLFGERPSAYLLPVNRETWRIGTQLAVRETIGQPYFFDPEVETAYYQAGLDTDDRVGQTIDTTFELPATEDPAWSKDPKALERQLRDSTSDDEADHPDDISVLHQSILIILESPTDPQLRSAVLTVLAHLDFEFTNQDGNIALTAKYTDAGQEILETQVFNSDGHLVESTVTTVTGLPELGVPPNTNLEQTIYGIPELRAWDPTNF